MRLSSLLFVVFTFFVVTQANAALITVNDGDQFNYDINDTYQFTGSLSATNQILTYGANVDPGEIMSFVVNAPFEFDLLATLSTGPNGSGTGIITPNGNDTIPSGTSFEFPIDGNFFTPFTHWLSIGIGSEAIPFIDSVHGGALHISSISSSPSFDQGGGNTGGTGNTGGGTGSTAVPIPSTLLLFAGALLGLGNIQRKKINA